MKVTSVVLAGALALVASAASAQTYVERRVTVRPSGYLPPPAPQGMVSADEIRDYQMDQLEMRQEAEERALEMRHLAERRAIDPDED
ncbi:hypothetical protein [Enterovirga aerilata]|uniref:DUF4148 domain-containing protein n=1 Tax=Enterovirga aerilata TaxID=2730920 RepID=A0A849I867_9HYPH|nr:hypothetical protein [Enterovirga sp. DB1703]NNM72599.1 hypothetical protein [Enterovirga sp. DB1703]